MACKNQEEKKEVTRNDDEFIEAAIEKLGFLTNEYQFEVFIKHSQGVFLSAISFKTSFLEIDTGVVWRDNDFWLKFKPLASDNIPEFTIEELLNGITDDKDYFAENIDNKTEWPLITHAFPEYFEICALELNKHCQGIFMGDFSLWRDITKNFLFQQVEKLLLYYQYSGDFSLRDSDKRRMAPLLRYLEACDSKFSLSDVEHDVLEKLTS